MRFRAGDLRMLAVVVAMSAPPIAFMTFDFLFPNICTPSLEKNMLTMFLISALTGMPSGYFIRRMDLAIISVILYTLAGYMLALAYYSAPYTIYDLELILPGFYYTYFFRYTIVALLIFVLGGFIGSVFGQFLKESMSKEQTRLTWAESEE